MKEMLWLSFPSEIFKDIFEYIFFFISYNLFYI